MSGRWILLTDHEHRCELPVPSYRTGPGSIWECDCERRYVVLRQPATKTGMGFLYLEKVKS